MSYPLDVCLFPVEVAEVDITADEEHGITDYFAGETGGHGPLQPPAGAEDVNRVQGLTGSFNDQGGTGVAGSGNTVKVDVAQGCHEQGRGYHP